LGVNTLWAHQGSETRVACGLSGGRVSGSARLCRDVAGAGRYGRGMSRGKGGWGGNLAPACEPNSLKVSAATRAHSDMVEMRRGCVHATRSKPAWIRYCGTCGGRAALQTRAALHTSAASPPWPRCTAARSQARDARHQAARGGAGARAGGRAWVDFPHPVSPATSTTFRAAPRRDVSS
jgi:hypothetical protein